MLTTTFTALAGRVPIQQAPMGPIASPELVTSVADAGGVGIVAALGMTPGTSKPTPPRCAPTASSPRTSPPPASTRRPWRSRRRGCGPSASAGTTPAPGWRPSRTPAACSCAGRWASRAGRASPRTATTPGPTSSVHGAEAGGHVRGHTALPPPLESVLDEVDVPVLAAGGVGTAPRRGRGAHRRSRLSRRIRVGTRIEAMALYTHEAVAAVTEVRGAAVVVRELAEGAERLLAR